MSTYRVGHHQPQNVYRGEQYIGVMFTAEDAALAVEALNATEAVEGVPKGWLIEHVDLHTDTPVKGCTFCPAVADSCTCAQFNRSGFNPDPACPVHQGRRARGPKPPPLGPGCICDGSGRTCPRHGAVM